MNDRVDLEGQMAHSWLGNRLLFRQMFCHVALLPEARNIRHAEELLMVFSWWHGTLLR